MTEELKNEEDTVPPKIVMDQAGKLINSAWLEILACLDFFASNNLVSTKQQANLLNEIRGSIGPLVDMLTKWQQRRNKIIMTEKKEKIIHPNEHMKNFMKEVYNREDFKKIMQGLADHDKTKD